ncbi:MAG: PQQ-dependent sugar dehydrogenase [bacterium]|nr:PQQ-dependent sugar dehydrogenase [bacterium]
MKSVKLFAFAGTLLAITGSPLAQQLELQSITTASLNRPTTIVPIPGQPGMYVMSELETGIIRVGNDQSLQLVTPFLDLSGVVLGGWITGLSGMAFHPDYENNGRFFVRYNWDDPAQPGLDCKAVVEEYSVPAGTPFVANPTPVQRIVVVDMPNNDQGFHHATGDLAFGPDGMLYAGIGDNARPGGPLAPKMVAQDPNVPLGALLRMDVDAGAPFIPANNPFVGGGGHPLVWAYGLRNPQAISFDELTGDLYISDVGQATREEVNRQFAASTGGENYGWPCREGTLSGPGVNDPGCTGGMFVAPWYEYAHGAVSAVIGGFVYRGDRMPWLYGFYIYADYMDRQVFALDSTLTNPTFANAINLTGDLMLGSFFTIAELAAVVADENGDPLLVRQPGSAGAIGDGRVFRVAPQTGFSSFGSFCSALPNMTGVPGVLTASGSAVISNNNAVLTATSVPNGALALVVYSDTRTNLLISNGRLCVGDPVRRITPAGTIAGGTFVQPLDLPNLPTPITVASTWYFQLWHRDGPGQSNFTGGVWAVFTP